MTIRKIIRAASPWSCETCGGRNSWLLEEYCRFCGGEPDSLSCGIAIFVAGLAGGVLAISLMAIAAAIGVL